MKCKIVQAAQLAIKQLVLFAMILFCNNHLLAQLRWTNANSQYAPLPKGFNIYKTQDSLDGKPFIAYYVIADLANKELEFTTDTSSKRRLTPTEYFKKNGSPLLVMNTTFFSFATHQNLNIVIKDGQLVSYNIHSIPGKGKDTFTYRHPFIGALGISKNRKADIAWIYSDSSIATALASQVAVPLIKDSIANHHFNLMDLNNLPAPKNATSPAFQQWKMQTAVGGGPVLVQNGQIKISNNEEIKFAGKAINDQHPRTLIGYTKDHQLILMVIEGRNPGVAEGVSLPQAAQIMVDLNCIEALNLDGGGSSCMLINGKQTIYPSDKGEERAVPSVFIIRQK